jgi:capsular polysaccharide biosynthesis protein
VVKALDDRALQEDVIAKKTANVRVIQEAETPVAPTNLRLVILAAGVLLTLFTGFLATLLSNVFRRGYISQEAVEHDLGLPVLVRLPLLHLPPEPITLPDAAKP